MDLSAKKWLRAYTGIWEFSNQFYCFMWTKTKQIFYKMLGGEISAVRIHSRLEII